MNNGSSIIRLFAADKREYGDHDLSTREGMLGMIRSVGEYIVDHAENILGEYPGELLFGIDVTASIKFGAYPTIEVKREHALTARGSHVDVS